MEPCMSGPSDVPALTHLRGNTVNDLTQSGSRRDPARTRAHRIYTTAVIAPRATGKVALKTRVAQLDR